MDQGKILSLADQSGFQTDVLEKIYRLTSTDPKPPMAERSNSSKRWYRY
jgi:hypothetical protein